MKRLFFVPIFLLAFPVFSQTEKVLILKNGTEVPFQSLRLTEDGYLVCLKDGTTLQTSDVKIRMVTTGQSSQNSTVYYRRLSQMDEKKTKKRVVTRPLKWNLSCPPPKILPKRVPS